MKKEKDLYQVSLKLFLKNEKNEVLLLKSVERGSYAGFYDLPGGRIDIDEFRTDFSEIVAREIREEVGDVEYHFHRKPVAVGRHLIPAALASTGKDTHVLYLFFVADYVDGDLEISNEHTAFLWADLSRIEPDRYFISGILEGVRMHLSSNV
jgi:8-oxo-dGTP pyrophosphatase MutT (NUDIX family)